MPKFVHLHGHTEYSLLDGLSKIKKLVKSVKAMEMPAVAITDHGSMYGAIEHYKACVAEGVKPIIGCELYVAKRSHKDKDGKLDKEPFHLTVLAKNYQGYLNLMKLVSIGHLEGYYYRPRVDRELLKEYHQGLIVLSGCPAGEFIRNLKEDSLKEAEEVAKAYLDIFGEENYYLELQNHEYDNLLKNSSLDPKVRSELQEMADIQKLSWRAVKELSKKLGIRIVGTNDFHYIEADDAQAQDALVCVQTGKFIKDIDRLRMIDTPNLYLKSPDEMAELFKDLPEALENTVRVAQSVDLEITLGKANFPIFDIPQGLTPMEYLRQECFKRFEEKFSEEEVDLPGGKQGLKDRLEYELSIIEKKNYPTYFLIVADFMNWANSQGIITNTRGSAAGSLVLYVMGVTHINPVAYMLPFERFLNPFRPSLPDIDADMADDRRDEIIRYVMKKYGEDKVAHIVTFGTMMGRAAIRDIGRVLGMPYGEVDSIAKLVPPPHQGFHKSLDEAIKEVPELEESYKSNPQVKTLLDLAQKVEGTVRHASVHAAGVVIAPEPLTNFSPLQRESNGDKIVTQYDMFSVGEDGIGLVKMDFLGIRNLSILGHAVEIIKDNRGTQIDLNNLPLDDKKAYALLSRGETMGLFQLEGSGMTRYMVELGPTNIFDIMAMIALYRPGPLSIIPEYIARKHDPSKIEYFDPRMKEYLERSLGLLVYQDDVLLTAINIAGYTWEEADKFRKAMGKKIPEEMAKQKDHFIHGCIEKGMEEDRAHELFKLIEPFAAYGFNKAHAASYAMVSYQTAYLKANFPVEFMAAVMTAEYGDTEKIASAMEECKRLGVLVLPPDINKSKVGFTIENLKDLSQQELERQLNDPSSNTYDQAIRFGLSAIKNVGISAIESIIQSREKIVFQSLADLCLRVDTRLVNHKTLESLIKAGALDNFGSRAAQLLILDKCLELSHNKAKKGNSKQVGLFEEDQEEITEVSVPLPEVEELEMDQLLGFEKDLLGFYLHEPLFLKHLRVASSYVSVKLNEIDEEKVNKKITVAAVLTNVKKVTTKKSAAEMAFIRLSDTLTEIEAVVFPTTYQEAKSFLEKDKVVIVAAKVDKRDEQISLVVDKIFPFSPDNFDPTVLTIVNSSASPVAQKQTKNSQAAREVQITVPQNCGSEVLKQINKTLREYPGKEKVALFLPSKTNDLKKLDLPFGVNFQPVLAQKLEEVLGKGSIRLT